MAAEIPGSGAEVPNIPQIADGPGGPKGRSLRDPDPLGVPSLPEGVDVSDSHHGFQSSGVRRVGRSKYALSDTENYNFDNSVIVAEIDHDPEILTGDSQKPIWEIYGEQFRPASKETVGGILRLVISEAAMGERIPASEKNRFEKFDQEAEDLYVGRKKEIVGAPNNGVKTQVTFETYNQAAGTEENRNYFAGLVEEGEGGGYGLAHIRMEFNGNDDAGDTSGESAEASVGLHVTSGGNINYEAWGVQGAQQADVEDQLSQWGLPVTLHPADDQVFQTGNLMFKDSNQFLQALRIFIAESKQSGSDSSKG